MQMTDSRLNRCVEWAQNEIAVVPAFHKRILFSDEAHFWLNGYVNKQNCRVWSEANPQVYVETPLHPEKLTVWCALWAGGIIGPYFFKNDEGHNELWFQQDGAICHTARATIDLLKDTFGDRLIPRFGPVNWPPRSCDLTPLDYFLWGYVKSLVYADKSQTLNHLEDNIRRVIADIRPQMLEKSKIGRPDWTTSEPAVAVLCQNSSYPHQAALLLYGKNNNPRPDTQSSTFQRVANQEAVGRSLRETGTVRIFSLHVSRAGFFWSDRSQFDRPYFRKLTTKICCGVIFSAKVIYLSSFEVKSFSTITLASGHGKDSYRRVAQHLLAHILPTKETTAYITFSTLRPNETVKISPSKSGDSADMAETQPQSKSRYF
ncbi:DUF4817 domain-containing protein [Trichonephila clavipes]|nr:DUF4817 domain-containing protein [Trichonephila clavipes]